MSGQLFLKHESSTSVYILQTQIYNFSSSNSKKVFVYGTGDFLKPRGLTHQRVMINWNWQPNISLCHCLWPFSCLCLCNCLSIGLFKTERAYSAASHAKLKLTTSYLRVPQLDWCLFWHLDSNFFLPSVNTSSSGFTQKIMMIIIFG